LITGFDDFLRTHPWAEIPAAIIHDFGSVGIEIAKQIGETVLILSALKKVRLAITAASAEAGAEAGAAMGAGLTAGFAKNIPTPGKIRTLLLGANLASIAWQIANEKPEDRAQTPENAKKKQSGIWEGLGASKETAEQLADPNWLRNTLKGWLGITNEPVSRNEGDTGPDDFGAGSYQHGGIVRINAHEGEMVLPRNISEGLQRMMSTGISFGGGDSDEIARTLDELNDTTRDYSQRVQQWLSGSTGVVPYVRIQETPGKEKQQGAGGAGAGGAGAGAGAGGGGAGAGGGGAQAGGAQGQGGGGAEGAPAAGAAPAGGGAPLPAGVPQKGTKEYDNLIGSIIHQESRGNPTAGSPKGARGLMQLMPGTAKELGVEDPTNPAQNVKGGVKYFDQMLRKYGNVKDALVAYNWGPGNADKWIKGGRSGALPQETQKYINNIERYQTTGEGAKQAQRWGNLWGAGQPQPGQAQAGAGTSPVAAPATEVLAEASKVARTGGARAVKEFIRTKGYNVNNDWCGDFTNAIVASTGAKTPTNPSLASNWLQWGQEVSPENVQAGDVAVKTQSRFGGPTTPGQRGGHVGVIGPGGFDPKTGQVYIQQGNVSGGKYREGWDKPGEWTFRRAIPTDAMLAAQVATQQPAAQQQVPQQPVAQQDPSKLYGKDLENYYKSDEYNNRQIHERAMERYYGPGETKGPMEKGNDLYKEQQAALRQPFQPFPETPQFELGGLIPRMLQGVLPAILHPGEMILPRGLSDGLQGLIGAFGGGGRSPLGALPGMMGMAGNMMGMFNRPLGGDFRNMSYDQRNDNSRNNNVNLTQVNNMNLGGFTGDSSGDMPRRLAAVHRRTAGDLVRNFQLAVR
jgi:hypothetical protein